ncbi:ABC transporter permease [Caulobacter endophyticus]|uniref:ABC transporter permease n=1 Tax=Caulobacter endophyticus TaxID=2172652 RepID=A0A2T9KDK8_9CAUL|nr:ABC transporter permease [Caulobacter endophyticus]PVM94061.1 ABC transporter permease [Caulobacter endophyticus]
MSLALATLLYEWRRYLAAIIALAFSGLLVLAQVGMFTGIGKAFTATIDRSPADIMVLGPKAESLMNGGNGLPRRVMAQMYMHPEVVEVADLDGGGGMWSNDPPPGKKRVREWIQTSAVDTRSDAVTWPRDYNENIRVALLEPYSVAIDRTGMAKLGIQKLGDRASINGKTVYIRYILDGYPNMMQPTVVVSRDTLRLLGQASTGSRVGPLMVRIKDPARAEIVRDQLNATSDNAYRAWTRAELSEANDGAMMKESFIGIMLGFSVFLGLLIGVGITSQTLRGAILANIKEFASLRALGVSMGSLRMIVIELGFWTGVAGLFATAVLVGLVSQLAKMNGLPMSFPLPMVIASAGFLMLIAIVSGLLALGILKKSQPADLLR